MEAYPIPHQHADLVAQKLVMEFIARFGIPLELHTDQGKNFESDLFKSVCNLFQINKTRTTAYHPSSNGLIERFNKTLGGMIKTFVNKNVTNWDEYINLLLAAYRSTPHPATGFSPNYMMLGREALTEGKWKNHANAMAGKPLREDSAVHTFHKSTNPYNVKIGSDIFIKTTLITPSTQKSEIKEKFEEEFIPDYDEEITISEEEVAIMEVEVDERG
ncbi:Hypothetical predicted protein [Mytilus galloprovincialis]|uniref:Integrase catalytic domain-containing protein n=1 Tax=Mytilus galloprovincialis TaxID=29158 RepID=A0A8B6FK35_MYTGA|nr:Hypothetical predicted protein [Mytilus galloprovincialis]